MDEQTEIDMETNMDVDIRTFRPREDSQSTSLRSIKSNNFYCIYRSQPEMSLVWPETVMSRMAGDDC